METVLLVVQIIIVVALVGIILLQRNAADGLAGLGGSSGGHGLISSRAGANILTRATSILAGLFIINSLILAILAAHPRSQETSVFDTVPIENKASDTAVDKKLSTPNETPKNSGQPSANETNGSNNSTVPSVPEAE